MYRLHGGTGNLNWKLYVVYISLVLDYFKHLSIMMIKKEHKQISRNYKKKIRKEKTLIKHLR